MTSIINVSRDNFKASFYKLPREGAVAIQIADPCGIFPEPIFKGFSARHYFEFLDEDLGHGMDEFCMTQDQADEIVKILRDAYTNDQDVVVHCTAGLCRSGAVTEVGVFIGFDDPKVLRIPNVHCKNLMMRSILGDYTENDPWAKNSNGIFIKTL